MTDCPCKDPLIPTVGKYKDWGFVNNINLKLVADAADKKLDVVFYGDSITEGWRGTQFGHDRDRVQGADKVFASFFSKEHGGDFDGLALGIAGDTVSTTTAF